MKKKRVSLLLTSVLVALLCTGMTFSLDNTAMPYQMAGSEDGLTAVVRNFEDLKAAVARSDVSGVYLLNDIEADDYLTISRNFTFQALAAETTIHVKTDGRYSFLSINGQEITVDFGNVVFDGGSEAACLTVRSSVHIKGGSFQNFKSVMTLNGEATVEGSVLTGNHLSYSLISVQPEGNAAAFTFKDCVISNNLMAENVGSSVMNGFGNVIFDHCTITSNRASGGISVVGKHNNSDHFILNSCLISDNISDEPCFSIGHKKVMFRDILANGNISREGIFRLSQQVPDSYKVINSQFISNQGAANGVFDLPYAGLLYLSVDADSLFSGNTANTGYFMTDRYDISIHQQQIKATQFSVPFQHAYNNCDISYKKGTATISDAANKTASENL